MEEGKKLLGHIVVVPFPDGQGHINPILQFSKRLAFKGLKVTVLHTHETNDNDNDNNDNDNIVKKNYEVTGCIKVELRPRVPYKLETGEGEGEGEGEGMESYIHRVKTSTCFHLANLIGEHKNSESPICFVVYDSLTPWVLDVARGFGVDGAPFFTESCAVNAIFYHINRGWLNIPIADTHTPVSLPHFPLDLHTSDFPSLIPNPQQYPVFLSLMIHQFSYNHPHCDWMFINTSHALEPQVLKWIQSYIPLKTVGPTVPSLLIHKLGVKEKDDRHYGMDLIKSTKDEDNKIIHWLDSQQNSSVVYVSFGSVSKVEEDQMKELAWGLKAANTKFLWVIKEPQTPKQLLGNKYFEEIKEMGMVVKWCSQVQVLAHKSVGCFFTHCGWNSVLEALCCGVPMVAMPQWTDQMTNAKFVEDVWKVGVRVCPPKQNGIVGGQEIESCIRKVMDGSERSLEMRQNASKWKKAVAQDQTSDNNIDEFVAQLTNPKI